MEPQLTASEERDLAVRVRQGDGEGRDILIRANHRLVAQIAHTFLRGRTDLLDDLIQEGQLGLIRAAEDYDGRVRFRTYAAFWVRQTIQMALPSLVETIRVRRAGRRLMRKWSAAEEQLRTTDSSVIAGHLDLGADEAVVVLRVRMASRPMGRDTDVVQEDRAEEEGVPDNTSAVEAMLVALVTLEEHHQRVLRLRYGLGGAPPLSGAQVAVQLGCSRQNVAKLEAKAKELLARRMTAGGRTG